MAGARTRLHVVPNWLSLFRFLSSPLVAVLIVIDAYGLRVPISVLFAVASLTDYLDGYLARRWNVVSQFGVFLDLAADKLLVATVLTMLVGLGMVPSWMAAIIIGRELIVSSLRSHAAAKGTVIAASPLGKWKTTITLVALVFTLLQIDHTVSLWLLAAATLLTLASGIDYLARYWQAAWHG